MKNLLRKKNTKIFVLIVFVISLFLSILVVSISKKQKNARIEQFFYSLIKIKVDNIQKGHDFDKVRKYKEETVLDVLKNLYNKHGYDKGAILLIMCKLYRSNFFSPIGNEEIIDLINMSMKDESEEVRLYSVASITATLGKEAAPDIKLMLEDPSWLVRRVAALSLNTFGDTSGIPCFIDMLDDKEIGIHIKKELQEVTGKDFEEKSEWLQWYESIKP